MGEKSSAFVKGGCGCLIAFAVLAVLVLLVGGNVRIDPCGAVCLFAAGGILGLIILAVYNKGRKDQSDDSRRHTGGS